MKLILLFVFVFSLDMTTLMAAKIPQHEKPKVPVSNDGALATYHVASLKRGIPQGSSGRWRKANNSPVCFGARNHQFGRFYVPSKGNLGAIKLVHLYGFVSCNIGSNYDWSFWGCGHNKGSVNIVVTNAANQIILPSNQFFENSSKWSRVTVPYYNAAFAPELVLPVFSHPRRVYKGQQFRVWYGEDLTDQTEHDNGGRSCCDVYVLYV